MKRFAILLVLLLLLPAILTACGQNTVLKFTNDTECGAAEITLTNIASGNIKEYSVEQGKSKEIEIEPATEYSYEVAYPRMANSMQCDTKRVTTMLEKGKTVNVHLTSELSEDLINATATAEAAQADSAE